MIGVVILGETVSKRFNINMDPAQVGRDDDAVHADVVEKSREVSRWKKLSS
jgi:hypothetical protein